LSGRRTGAGFCGAGWTLLDGRFRFGLRLIFYLPPLLSGYFPLSSYCQLWLIPSAAPNDFQSLFSTWLKSFKAFKTFGKEARSANCLSSDKSSPVMSTDALLNRFHQQQRPQIFHQFALEMRKSSPSLLTTIDRRDCFRDIIVDNILDEFPTRHPR